VCEGPPAEGFGTSEIVMHCGSIKGQHNVWCQELAWIAVGRRFMINHVASEFLSISVTRETGRTFGVADDGEFVASRLSSTAAQFDSRQ
jgi:hypothetical protein